MTATAAPTGYRPAYVVIWLDDAPARIAAYLPTDGHHWNGFEVPVFPADTLTTDAAAWATYAHDGCQDDPECDGGCSVAPALAPVVIDGAPYLTTGGGYCWTELATPAPGDDVHDTDGEWVAVVVSVDHRGHTATISDGVANEYTAPVTEFRAVDADIDPDGVMGWILTTPTA